MNEHVLVVEDDPVIQEGTELLLKRAGLQVWAADDGAAAVEIFGQHRFDAVVLDVMLPSLDGLEVCRQIRRVSQVPIVMLSARSETVDVVSGLELGADDYLTKPFHGPELVARVRAALRRARADERPCVVRTHDLEIDSAAFRVLQDGAELTLSATEFRLLLELARNPDRVLTRDVHIFELEDETVWGLTARILAGFLMLLTSL